MELAYVQRPGREMALPPEVEILAPAEREIALIVYELRSVTAEDVLLNVSRPLKNASVRSMLQRLIAKGIVKRRRVGSLDSLGGPGRPFVYTPALTVAGSRAQALRRFAEDHFAGCVQQAAAAVANLLANSGDRTIGSVRDLERQPTY